MKRGILLATLMVTAAGVASANLLTDESRTASAPAAPVTSRPAAAQPATVALPRPAAPIEPTAVETAPASVTQKQPKTAQAAQKVSVEMRQAPVPLQVKPRPAAKLPTVESVIATQSTDTKAGDAKPGDEAPGDTAAATADGFNESKAKAAIEADGYKGVTALRKGENGTWRAKAMRGKTEVMLTVDASGSVAAD